jgi:hypothetical protein
VPWKFYFLGEIWEMLGKIFLLTLFDFDWIDVPWMPDLFKTQFVIAVLISIAFPLGASKYHNFLEGLLLCADIYPVYIHSLV